MKIKKIPNHILLCLLISIPYLLFLNQRVLRMAGDEKVYISQAIEMARHGNWFVQTLADEPNYFKGPLHYVGIRIGLAVFGNQLVAGLWMNLFFVLLASFALYQVGRKYFSTQAAFLLALTAGLNVGVFTHSLASQMEVELFAFFCFGIWALSLQSRKGDLLFWLFTGAIGWVKSPAHCVLMGAGGLLYWAWTGRLFQKMRTPDFWVFPILGALTCVLGYLPLVIADYPNFYETFVMRENLAKPNTNRKWHYVLEPLIHFSLPWTGLIIAAFWAAFRGAFQRTLKKKKLSDVAKLGLSIALPSLIFWSLWKYKGQNYNLPVLGGLTLFAVAMLDPLPKLAVQLIGALALLVGAGVCALAFHFSPLPEWWSKISLLTFFLGLGLFSLMFLSFKSLEKDFKRLAIGASAFFVAFGALITPFGTREIQDLNAVLNSHPSAKIYYYNLEPSIWSEWGLMQLATHREIQGLHRHTQFDTILQQDAIILLPHVKALEEIKEELRSRNPALKSEVTPWARWLTKGKTETGESRFAQAWKKRDLSLLEKTYFILRLY